jgi:hypothetical protein
MPVHYFDRACDISGLHRVDSTRDIKVGDFPSTNSRIAVYGFATRTWEDEVFFFPVDLDLALIEQNRVSLDVRLAFARGPPQTEDEWRRNAWIRGILLTSVLPELLLEETGALHYLRSSAPPTSPKSPARSYVPTSGWSVAEYGMEPLLFRATRITRLSSLSAERVAAFCYHGAFLTDVVLACADRQPRGGTRYR